MGDASMTSRSGDLRAVLSGRGFRRLLGARMTSQFADGLFQAGLAGSLLFNPNRQTDPLAIAAGFAILLLPYSVLGPYIGVFLDRLDRRAILHRANLLRAFLVLAVAALIWVDEHGAGFAGLALLVVAANRFFLAGLSAALPRVVDDPRLVTANALAGTLGAIVYSVGMFSAAVVIAAALVDTDGRGYASIAATATVGYLVSALLIRTSFRPGELGPARHERSTRPALGALLDVGRGFLSGVRHLAQRRPAAYALLVQSGHRYLYGVISLAVLLLYGRYFGSARAGETSRSLWALGQVVIAGAAGVGVAALITPPVTRRLGAHAWITCLVAGLGLVIFGLGLPFRATLLLIAAFLVNIGSQSMKIVVDATLQHECADPYRGRVFSVNDTGFNLSFVAGLFTAALTLPANGHSAAALVAVAVGYAALAAWYGVAARRWARPAGESGWVRVSPGA